MPCGFDFVVCTYLAVINSEFDSAPSLWMGEAKSQEAFSIKLRSNSTDT